ncbi:MAG: T9SS type A sorting domain-containing protein [Panacibacter sp.]
MKTTLLTLAFALFTWVGYSQITVPVVKANFGVEADLSANFFNNLAQPAVDDWFSNGYMGTGKGVIDTTGAAAIVAGYISNPATRKNSFAKLMAFKPYTIVNNRMMLDAVFHRDYHGDDSTVFASGSNKNGQTPATWTAPQSQSIPDKNDILDAMVHVRRAGPNATDSLWMFSGLSLENTTGNRFFDFELYQTDIRFNRSTLTFLGYGPDAGHTSWKLDAAGKIISPGDIIFTAEFSSSALTLVEARIWVNKSLLSVVPASFKWGGQFDGAGSSAQYGYANILPKTAGNFYTGLQSTAAATWGGPFKIVRDNDAVVNDYNPRQFMEFSVNLTMLGIEPANYGNSLCGSPFRRVLIKTRASTSFTAELKDFIAPFSLFNYAPVEAYTELLYYCGTMPDTKVEVINPNVSFVYTWYTNNGNIIGSNTGPSIMVNAPGTYYVQQQLHEQCSYSSLDSVTIMYTATCLVLDASIKGLKATKQATANFLTWEVSNNELVKEYVIEASTDNKHFNRLGTMLAKNLQGTAVYSYDDVANSNAPVVFYRIRITGINDVYKWSNIAVVRSATSGKKEALIYPVPTKGPVKLSYNSSANDPNVKTTVFNSYGAVVISSRLNLVKGENLVNLPSLSGLPNGTYYVMIKTIDGEIKQKLILN